MNNTFRGILSLFIILLFSCEHGTQKEINSPSNSSESYISSVNKTRDGKIALQTDVIFQQLNLPSLTSFLEKDSLKKERSVSKIPFFIRSFLDELTGGFDIASPDEEWRAGCTFPIETDNSIVEEIVGSNTGDTLISAAFNKKDIPARQLTYFSMGEKTAIMIYEKGGFVKTAYLLLFRLEGNEIVDFWSSGIGMETSLDEKSDIIAFLKDVQDQNIVFPSSSILSL